MKQRDLSNAIIRNLPIGFSVVNRQGRIIEFNKKAREITKYTKKEALKNKHLDLLHESSDTAQCPLIHETLNKGTRVVAFETIFKGKDGNNIDVTITSFPILDASGKIVGAAQLFRDVTRARQRAREYKNFLSMYIHDMKNYIITSRGFLGRLKSGKTGTLTNKQKECAGIINSSLESLEHLVFDFLDFSSFETKTYKLSLSSFDIIKLLGKIIHNLSIQAEKKRVRIVPELPNKEVKIEADAMMMERLLNNLLNNAIKYSHENQDIFVRCLEKDKNVAVDFIDTGSVIKDGHLPYLFDAFYRVSQDIKGTGLGLAIAKRIVELHGGKIFAMTTPEKRTVFTFVIPRKPRNSKTLPKKKRQERTTEGGEGNG